MSTSEGGVLSVHHALGAAFRSVYHHSVATVAVSFGWFLACLPLITIGPATLGAYAAVQSIRRHGHVDRGEIRSVIADHWHHATLLGIALLVFAGLTVTYMGQYLRTESILSALLGVGSLYLTAHLWTILVVAFIRLTEGAVVSDAVGAGYHWTIQQPTETVILGIVSVVLLAVTIPLTIAVVLLFPMLTFTFHVELIGNEVTAD